MLSTIVEFTLSVYFVFPTYIIVMLSCKLLFSKQFLSSILFSLFVCWLDILVNELSPFFMEMSEKHSNVQTTLGYTSSCSF